MTGNRDPAALEALAAAYASGERFDDAVLNETRARELIAPSDVGRLAEIDRRIASYRSHTPR